MLVGMKLGAGYNALGYTQRYDISLSSLLCLEKRSPPKPCLAQLKSIKCLSRCEFMEGLSAHPSSLAFLWLWNSLSASSCGFMNIWVDQRAYQFQLAKYHTFPKILLGLANFLLCPNRVWTIWGNWQFMGERDIRTVILDLCQTGTFSFTGNGKIQYL